MEVKFETKSVSAYRECLHQIKRTQVSMESVVPDVSDDIGRIITVRPTVLLKSKDLTSDGISISGELSITLLYINELENAVGDLHMSQTFTLLYDAADTDQNDQAQIKLFVSNADAHILNSRKVSVTVEVCGELSVFRPDEIRTECGAPENDAFMIFAKRDREEGALINAVCEKTFVVNEQFVFPPEDPAPKRIASHTVDFSIRERQLIGSKVLMKGTVNVDALYFSDGTEYPSQAVFSAPFSQLVDIGQEKMDLCSVQVEPTSVYFNLIDTISGEKAIDAEIHAVAEVVSRYGFDLQYVSDAYSCLMPSELDYEPWHIAKLKSEDSVSMETDAEIELPEECTEILTVLPSLGQTSLGPEKSEIFVSLDILYRNTGDALSSTRRTLSMTAKGRAGEIGSCTARLLECAHRSAGNRLELHMSAELICEEKCEAEVRSVVSMDLNEELPYDAQSLPSVTVVRVDNESLWDLAKSYHSSCERIEALNEIDGSIKGKLLLIPKHK
ncbi:MAG: DUF3794 domain-containing protein [Oscillospiraceae bacterium]|nr:DUF3794 domain-containing protein [Oscillospiraceae bacterium]